MVQKNKKRIVEFKSRTFDKNEPAAAYDKEALENFILTVGMDAWTEWGQIHKDFLQQVYKDKDISPDDSPSKKNEVTRSPDYRKSLHQLMYDYVVSLGDKVGNTADITVSTRARANIRPKIDKDDINEFYQSIDENNDTLRKWILKQDPLGFNSNALTEVISKLGIKGVSDITKSSKNGGKSAYRGDVKKMKLFELIKNNDYSSGRKSPRNERTSPRTSSVAVSPVIATRLSRNGRDVPVPESITSYAQLTSIKVPELRKLARELKLGNGAKDKKAELVKSISEHLKLVPFKSKETILKELAAIAELDDIDEIKEEMSKFSADELNQATKSALNPIWIKAKMSSSTGISNPSIPVMVEHFTNDKPIASRERESRDIISSSRFACENASTEEVMAEARKLQINVRGKDHYEICDDIYQHYRQVASDKILASLSVSGVDLMSGTEAARTRAVQKVAKLGNFNDVTTLNQLLDKWLREHYSARLFNFARPYRQDLEEYLEDGTIPSDPGAISGLALVFSDIQPVVPNESIDEKISALGSLYSNFIKKVKEGDYNVFQSKQSQYSFNQRYSRNRSPVADAQSNKRTSRMETPVTQRIPSPVVSPKPLRTSNPTPVKPRSSRGATARSSREAKRGSAVNQYVSQYQPEDVGNDMSFDADDFGDLLI